MTNNTRLCRLAFGSQGERTFRIQFGPWDRGNTVNAFVDLPAEFLSNLNLLDEWRWLVGDDKRVFAVSLSGDVFIEDKDGVVFWLDCGCARLAKIADARQEFYHLTTDPANAETWFMVDHIHSLELSGNILGPGQCYGFKIPPILGGRYDSANRTAIDLKEHISFLGSLYGKVRELPDGTNIRLSFE